MKTFWLLLAKTPKASLMLPAVLIMQILKRVGICPAFLTDATISDIFDLLSACAGIYGLYYALHQDPNAVIKPDQKPPMEGVNQP